jgi:hypothetical protein
VHGILLLLTHVSGLNISDTELGRFQRTKLTLAALESQLVRNDGKNSPLALLL